MLPGCPGLLYLREASCLVARRENVLYIRIEQNGTVLKEQAVESPQHAMQLAKLWDKEYR